MIAYKEISSGDVWKSSLLNEIVETTSDDQLKEISELASSK